MVQITEKIKKMIDNHESLRQSSLRSEPHHYDFGEKMLGDAWEFGFQIIPKIDEELEEDDEEREEQYMPIYNTIYPLNGFMESDYTKDELLNILDISGNITLIKIIDNEDTDEQYFLGLTGCGMDFSWDIACAYINLGYYPPLWINLSRFAEPLTDDKRQIIAFTKDGCKCEIQNINTKIERLEKDEQWMENYTAEFEQKKENV